mmetsp:Transcript_3888/g.4449  ORF Transcript_3888/g.4449 Transcript_3888/m.4449 type:complete len:479 (+) Transcript_3888:90-1526(+)
MNCLIPILVSLLSLSIQFINIQADETSSSSTSLRYLSPNLTTIYFIGDLHGDVTCAKKWVERTNLIDFSTTPYTWKGKPTEAIVFLGDYVDKGSTSASVLSFVRDVQTALPDNVVSILGNHDFFQVMDASLLYDEDNPHPLQFPQHDYAYSFIHPEEYIESGYSPQRDDDDEIMNSILEALEYVYDRRLEGNVKMCTSSTCLTTVSENGYNYKSNDGSIDLLTSIPPFYNNVKLSKRARERLNTWRNEYSQGLLDAGLLHWMAKQPLIAIVGDALLVHGGLALNILNHAVKVAKANVATVEDTLHGLINTPFQAFFNKHFNQTETANSITDRLKEGYAFDIILNIVQDRSYFKPNGCKDVETVLSQLQAEKIKRICVGHTPRDYAEELCDGKLLASDSTLSRSFRAYGNHYCPLNDKFLSNNGKGSCSSRSYISECEGSISILVRDSPDDDWPVHVRHLTSADFYSGGKDQDMSKEEL